MPNDTQNSLTDFDMCLALAQKAINSQMGAAWESWIARSELSEAGEMKDFALVSIYDNEFKTSGWRRNSEADTNRKVASQTPSV